MFSFFFHPSNLIYPQANIQFQARSWKTSSQLKKKDLAKAEAKIEKLEAQLAEKQKELEVAQARNVKLQDEKENVIDMYMDTKDFKDLMTAHDSLIYLEYYKDGWDGAVKAILERHPGTFTAADFPCPPLLSHRGFMWWRKNLMKTWLLLSLLLLPLPLGCMIRSLLKRLAPVPALVPVLAPAPRLLRGTRPMRQPPQRVVILRLRLFLFLWFVTYCPSWLNFLMTSVMNWLVSF